VDDAQSWDVTEPINKKPRFSGNQQWQPSAWKAHVRKGAQEVLLLFGELLCGAPEVHQQGLPSEYQQLGLVER
jgi:hypothetical protein